METKDTTIILKNAPFLVRLEPSLHQDLMAMAKREKVHAAELARTAIRELMKAMKKAKR